MWRGWTQGRQEAEEPPEEVVEWWRNRQEQLWRDERELMWKQGRERRRETQIH